MLRQVRQEYYKVMFYLVNKVFDITIELCKNKENYLPSYEDFCDGKYINESIFVTRINEELQADDFLKKYFYSSVCGDYFIAYAFKKEFSVHTMFDKAGLFIHPTKWFDEFVDKNEYNMKDPVIKAFEEGDYYNYCVELEKMIDHYVNTNSISPMFVLSC